MKINKIKCLKETLEKRNIDFSNFHDGTFANFKPINYCLIRKPDFISGGGSSYWDLGHGVIRRSNHFKRRVRSCDWLLNFKKVEHKINIAYCAYSDFWVKKYIPIYKTKKEIAQERKELLIERAVVLKKAKRFKDKLLSLFTFKKLYLNGYTGRGRYISKSRDYVCELKELLIELGLHYKHFDTGNDAPRGGFSGDFIKLKRTAKRLKVWCELGLSF